MRIWDVNPGYLNRQSLLGEHRELHAVVSILTGRKPGYSRHPEVLRWVGFGWALRQRHRLISAEMSLRGYRERTPVLTRARPGAWPSTYVDEAAAQFRILEEKYAGTKQGRIPLPGNSSELWAQHKFSVLARDPAMYGRIGKEVSSKSSENYFARLSVALVEALRQPPTAGGLQNALEHMWGHVSGIKCGGRQTDPMGLPPARLLAEIQRRALMSEEPYLLASTALGELAAWPLDRLRR